MITVQLTPELINSFAALTGPWEAAAWMAASISKAVRRSDLRFINLHCTLYMTNS